MSPLELKSTSDGCDSLHGMWVRVIQTLIPEGSGPLVVLSELACYSIVEKEMAAHSSVLAWRIPGTGEPGGLPSMGWHRVGHD